MLEMFTVCIVALLATLFYQRHGDNGKPFVVVLLAKSFYQRRGKTVNIEQVFSLHFFPRSVGQIIHQGGVKTVKLNIEQRMS